MVPSSDTSLAHAGLAIIVYGVASVALGLIVGFLGYLARTRSILWWAVPALIALAESARKLCYVLPGQQLKTAATITVICLAIAAILFIAVLYWSRTKRSKVAA